MYQPSKEYLSMVRRLENVYSHILTAELNDLERHYIKILMVSFAMGMDKKRLDEDKTLEIAEDLVMSIENINAISGS